MANFLISIIVPVYNVEKYLCECIDSIIEQTYKNLEIILVDDGSTDNSGSICDEYALKDSRIKVVHKKNGGLSDARNAGIDIAKGEYIGFVDSDDWIEPSMYEKLIKAIEKYDADIALCDLFREYVDKTIKHPTQTDVVYVKEVAQRKLLVNNDIHDHAVTKLSKRELWSDIRYPVGKYYEDILTTYKLFLKSNKVVNVRECLYHYRQRKGSIIRNGFNDVKLSYLEAVENFRNIPELYNIYKPEIELRILNVKYQLLRELFLYSDHKIFFKYKSLAKNWHRDIQNRKKDILNASGIPKNVKLFTKLSFLNVEFLREFFRIIPSKAKNVRYYE